MILLNTTPLVALCDPRDGLNRRALRDLDRLAREPLVLCLPVLTEACSCCRAGRSASGCVACSRSSRWRPTRATSDDEPRLWLDVFEWLLHYQDHDPDWADGYLAVVAGIERRARVWTYDREFRTTWRRPDGSRIPLAVA